MTNQTNTINENNKKEDIMSKFNPKNCHAINVSGKRKGLQCGNPKGMLTIDDGRYLCNNHLKQFTKTKGVDFKFVDLPPVQEQLITHLELPQPDLRVRTPAQVIAGIEGVHRASEVLASIDAGTNPITHQYLNKETITMPSPTPHGDKGQPNEEYELHCAEHQDQEFALLSLTGHRPPKIGGYNPNVRYWVCFFSLAEKIKSFVTNNPDKQVIIGSGLALGIDQLGLELAKFLDLPAIGFCPLEGFNAKWPSNSRMYLNELIEETCSEYWLQRVIDERNPTHHATINGVMYVSEPGYMAAKLHKRNHVMVDASDAMLALWDGTPGGTKNCLDYIVKKEVPRVIIHTKDLTITDEAKDLHALTS
jgi:uncharacterized phage-like protein YoqJ